MGGKRGGGEKAEQPWEKRRRLKKEEKAADAAGGGSGGPARVAAACQRLEGRLLKGDARASPIEFLCRSALEAMRGQDAAGEAAALEVLRRRTNSAAAIPGDGTSLARAVMFLALAGVTDKELLRRLAGAVALAAPSMADAAKREACAALGVSDVEAPEAFWALGCGPRQLRL